MKKASFETNKKKIVRNALDLALLSGGSSWCLKRVFIDMVRFL